MIKIISSLILSVLFSVSYGQSNPKWDINGSTWLGSAKVNLYFPLATADLGLKYAVMPGLDLSIRKIRNYKKEWELSAHVSGHKYPYEGGSFHDGGFRTDNLVKANYFGTTIGRRRYSRFLDRGIAPFGLYFRLALRYETMNATIPAGQVRDNGNQWSASVEQKYQTKSAGVVFGVGKEFPIRDKLFMGFSTDFAFLIQMDETVLSNNFSSITQRMNDIAFGRNGIIVNYNISYLL